MDKSFRHSGSFFAIVICSIFLGLNGCENPGSVGSGLTGSDAEVITDTIFVKGVQAVEPVPYSGELAHFSAGYYNDPLFGSFEATSFIKPGLPASDDSMPDDAEMYLRIMLNEDLIYGNQSAPQEFGIYEIQELWRDRALKLFDDIQINTNEQLGAFTVENEDSLEIELSSDWVAKYREFANDEDADSLYRYNFHGLAIVSESNNKIIPIRRDSSQFVVKPPEADTFDVAINQSGYNLKRAEQADLPSGSAPIYSTTESIINFDSLGISSLDIPASAFSRAELVLHQNNSTMEQSLQSEPTSVQRPQQSTVYLHFVDSTGVPDNIDPGGRIDDVRRIEGEYSATDGTYRFGITNLVDRIIQAGVPEDLEFFITSPNNGVIKPGLIYTDSDQVPRDKRPQIIITSLKNNNK